MGSVRGMGVSSGVGVVRWERSATFSSIFTVRALAEVRATESILMRRSQRIGDERWRIRVENGDLIAFAVFLDTRGTTTMAAS